MKLTKKAQKGYESLILEDYRKKINILLLTLAGDSYPAKIYDMIKLNENTCRIRLGRVRVQYTVFENENVILVYKIELRDDSTYKS
ncbi:MAG: hypothetical protein Q7S22_06965 [Candidatus Micrarchaeota archaeon]|nr:hypothetical protein [Candidatus Micrarchaeota archaeon]